MINEWLEKFKTAWLTKQINDVLALFTNNVEYWETPFLRINGKEKLHDEWLAIQNQKNIVLEMHVVITQDSTHLVKWDLTYSKDNKHYNWAGVYIIRINNSGLCEYFYQVGEERK